LRPVATAAAPGTLLTSPTAAVRVVDAGHRRAPPPHVKVGVVLPWCRCSGGGLGRLAGRCTPSSVLLLRGRPVQQQAAGTMDVVRAPRRAQRGRWRGRLQALCKARCALVEGVCLCERGVKLLVQLCQQVLSCLWLRHVELLAGFPAKPGTTLASAHAATVDGGLHRELHQTDSIVLVLRDVQHRQRIGHVQPEFFWPSW